MAAKTIDPEKNILEGIMEYMNCFSISEWSKVSLIIEKLLMHSSIEDGIIQQDEYAAIVGFLHHINRPIRETYHQSINPHQS